MGTAAALGFLAARTGSRVGGVVFGRGPAADDARPASGASPSAKLLRRLDDRPELDMSVTAERARRRAPRDPTRRRDAGVVVVISDFLDPAGTRPRRMGAVRCGPCARRTT